MFSTFTTPGKIYFLQSDPFVCNKLGIAEFFAANFTPNPTQLNVKVIDVGCGIGAMGVFLAKQFNYSVTGIELNRIAVKCCLNNVKKYNLEEKFSVVSGDFSEFGRNYVGQPFDLIVSNPPIDPAVDTDEIEKFSYNFTEGIRNVESFSYLTNSWHDVFGLDLLDHIFLFAKEHLQPQGRVIISFCQLCDQIHEYVLEKALAYEFCVDDERSGLIPGCSIGLSKDRDVVLPAYVTRFTRKNLNPRSAHKKRETEKQLQPV